MRIEKIALITVFFLLLFSTASFGADVAKIGVFNFPKILEISSAGKAISAELTEKGKAMADDLKKKRKNYRNYEKGLNRKAR